MEILNRHAVDLPERVAGLPKELESRESQIPYDYDFSLEDPQHRVRDALRIRYIPTLSSRIVCSAEFYSSTVYRESHFLHSPVHL